MANGILGGGLQGGIAMAPTGNPYLIAGGALVGGVLGGISDRQDEERNRLITQSNRLSLEGSEIENAMARLNLQQARRSAVLQHRQQKGGDVVSKRLSELFSRLRG